MSKRCADCNNHMAGLWQTADPSKSDPTICVQCAHNRSVEANPEEAEKRRLEAIEAERRANADTLAKEVLVSTTDSIVGRQIASHIGIARGGTVRAKNAISDIGAGIKKLGWWRAGRLYNSIGRCARASYSSDEGGRCHA